MERGRPRNGTENAILCCIKKFFMRFYASMVIWPIRGRVFWPTKSKPRSFDRKEYAAPNPSSKTFLNPSSKIWPFFRFADVRRWSLLVRWVDFRDFSSFARRAESASLHSICGTLDFSSSDTCLWALLANFEIIWQVWGVLWVVFLLVDRIHF